MTCAFKNGALYFGAETDVAVKNFSSTENGINAYPNPVRESLTIINNEYPIDNVKLLNLFGKTIISAQVSPDKKQTLELSDLTSGIYVLEIYKEGKLIGRRKVIKN